MDGTAVKAISDITREATGKLVEIDGVVYSTTPLHDVRKAKPQAATLKLHTLGGLSDTVKILRKREPETPFVVHVHAFNGVSVYDARLVGDFRQRELFADVALLGQAFTFGQWLDSESFNIALQSLFVATADRAKVLALVGTLAEEAVRTTADDGVSQTVTARVGIVSKTAVDVPNPVTLAPFRTFREIKQPDSPFILRLQGGGESSKPKAALFEADGGAWQLEAISRIADWLVDHLDIDGSNGMVEVVA